MGRNSLNYPLAAVLNPLDVLTRDLVPLAEAMPASLYHFAPVEGMRTFSEQLMHMATLVFLTAALMRQVPSPYAPGEGDNGPAEVHSKEDVLAYLREALVYARAALEGLTEASAKDLVPTYFGPQSRAELAAGIIYHSYNHYGQMAVYARLCGIVPPSSQRES